MLLLGIWHTNYNLRYVSTTHVQFAFSAGTVFVLSAIQAISGPRLGRVTLASSLSQVESCVEYLSIMGGSWETAICAKEILLNFFDETLKPRLLLRGGDVNLAKFDNPCHDRTQTRVRAGSTAAASASPSGSQQSGDDSSYGVAPVPLSPVLPGGGGSLQYFPSAHPPVPGLGWPAVNTTNTKSGLQYHLTLSSPTVDHVPYAHVAHQDMDLDVGYPVDVSSAGDVPATGTSVDMMSFGVPEFGVGYQFDPRAHPQIALDFSAEELAIMDQIVRQQVGTNMMNLYQGT